MPYRLDEILDTPDGDYLRMGAHVCRRTPLGRDGCPGALPTVWLVHMASGRHELYHGPSDGLDCVARMHVTPNVALFHHPNIAVAASLKHAAFFYDGPAPVLACLARMQPKLWVCAGPHTDHAWKDAYGQYSLVRYAILGDYEAAAAYIDWTADVGFENMRHCAFDTDDLAPLPLVALDAAWARIALSK